jgi:riboflavin synthase
MFTGIITDVGRVRRCEPIPGGLRFRIETAYEPESIDIGASIACSGPCLTVVAKGREDGAGWFEVELSEETLARTTAGSWREGMPIGLERSLKIGDELGGHIVTGHIDGLAALVSREPVGGSVRLTFDAPAGLARFIAEKGSVALDGTSLTVNAVDGARFTVMLIPHTLAVTPWGERRPGDVVNLEVDLLARYAARLADARLG